MSEQKQSSTMEEVEIAKAALLDILLHSESRTERLKAAELLVEYQKIQRELNWIG